MPPRKATAAAAELPADPAQQVLAMVAGQCGAGALMQMGDQPPQVVEVVSTGSVGLDLALGIGGLPRGRVTEIYGPEATGKTTLALHAIACAQRAGGVAVFIDAEHALDLAYARNLGVDTDLLLLSQPDSGEQALEIADICVRSRMVDIVVIDSVAALVPRAEIEGEMGASHIGLQARLMSQALRKLTGAIGSTKTTCIFINQLREKVGVFFGNPEVTSGGKALKFYASVRLDCRRDSLIKKGEETIGHRLRVKVVKNKLAPPFREFTTDIIYGHGINREGELIDLGVACGAITQAGSYYTLPAADSGTATAVNGREKARMYLAAHPDAVAEVEARVRASALKITVPATPEPADLVAGSLADLAVPGPLSPVAEAR